MPVPSELRRQVAERARHRCEYCGLAQAGQEATFHVDHVIPVAARGEMVSVNLALACVSCSLRKGAREFARDPDSGEDVRLFNPRTQNWPEHIQWHGTELQGTTSTGRATVEALAMNRELVVAIREEEALRGRHPPRLE